MKNRRNFLKDVCPTVAFAFFGLSFLEACSGGDDDVETSNTGNGTGNGSANKGFTVNGSTYSIDLTHSNFSALSNVGGWMNGQNIGIAALFLRISSSEIKAYTNVCPHQQTNNMWELVNGNTFKCNRHQRSYSADCNSALTCYDSTLNDNTLSVTLS